MSWEALVLGLLAMTHLLLVPIAGMLLIGAFVRAWPKLTSATTWQKSKITVAIGAALMTMLVAVYLARPQSDATNSRPHLDLASLLSPIYQRDVVLTFAMPDKPYEVMEFDVLAWAVAALVVVALLVAVAVGWRTAPWSAGLLSVAVLVLLLNASLGYGSGWQHLGCAFLALVTLVVLNRTVLVADLIADPLTKPLRLQTIAFTGLLLLQVVSSVAWFTGPGRLPYSAAREAAGIVRAACPAGCPLVTDQDYAAAGVSAYLGAIPIHALNEGQDVTFTVWSEGANGANQKVSWDALGQQLRQRGPGALGVMSVLREPPAPFEVVGQTGPAVWGDETFIVVRLRN